jgi:hypothetical protein
MAQTGAEVTRSGITPLELLIDVSKHAKEYTQMAVSPPAPVMRRFNAANDGSVGLVKM